jgi:2',3'-cyclic-nucleotide 2'-phosphodiesterase (5'-nucleotidase family)
MVVQTGKNGHNMGWAQVDFDEAGVAHPVAVNLIHSGQFLPDDTALGLINQQLGASATVASLAQAYDNTAINTAPDAMAQGVADTLQMATGADLALVSSAEVKDGAEAGALTQRHLREMFPYASQHVVASVTGEQLLGAFRAMADALAKGEGHPSLLHTSHNLRMVINQDSGQLEQVLYHPPRLGHALSQADWQPLNPNATYTVASDAFTFNGQDYPTLKEAKVERALALPMRDLMAFEFYTESKRNHGQPLPLPVDNRLQLHA